MAKPIAWRLSARGLRRAMDRAGVSKAELARRLGVEEFQVALATQGGWLAARDAFAWLRAIHGETPRLRAAEQQWARNGAADAAPADE